MAQWLDLLESTPTWVRKLATSLLLAVLLYTLRFLACRLLSLRVSDQAKSYHWRRAIGYVHAVLLIFLVGRLWVGGGRSLATFLGLASAGVAIAMHDTISNLAGWLFILWLKPFKVGDRIQIGDQAGDVIDTRLFQFSIIEIGNWVDADQSTGRIVHVPNSRVLREPLANYETGFEYIWNEIKVLVTFESNWREAKRILEEVAAVHAEHLSEGAEEQIRLAAMKYMIYFKHLSPIVYTDVKDSGVSLTIRYIVKPRSRRTSQEKIWEAILDAFAQRDDIDLAYPTTRFYTNGERRGEAPGN